MKAIHLLIGAAIALTLFGCGGGGGGGAGTTAEADFAVAGRFQKGPFAIGSQISINELNNDLAPNGKVYNVQTTDNLGNFDLATRIKSHLVELVGDGFYMDELTGALSAARIQLRAVADLRSANGPVVVNVLTSLQARRLKKLIATGQSYPNAYDQSQREVLAAFGVQSNLVTGLSNLHSMDITGSGDQNAVLLAISSVLTKMAYNAVTVGGSPTASLSSLINSIALEIENDGTIGAATASAILDASSQVDLISVRTNVENYYQGLGISISAPNFEEWIDKNATGTLPHRFIPVNTVATGSLANRRASHTATRLLDGTVLVAGGQSDLLLGVRAPIGSAEVFDPTSGTWSPTSSLANPRSWHSATLLSSGKVLVAGGTDGNGQTALTSAEIYDPNNGTWAATGAMTVSRWGHAATLLPDGRVLVTGGDSNDSPTDSAEIYDPVTGLWATVAPLSVRRMLHKAVLLQNGHVLVMAGFGWPAGLASAASAEIYNPTTGTWTLTGAPITPRHSFTATLLPTGKVMIAGGAADGAISLSSAEFYDPSTGQWTVTGRLSTPRYGHSATLLGNGHVFISGGGGVNGSPPLASNEVFDQSAGTWSLAAPMVTARGRHTATLLGDGKVLIAGGEVATDSNSIVTSSAELDW